MNCLRFKSLKLFTSFKSLDTASKLVIEYKLVSQRRKLVYDYLDIQLISCYYSAQKLYF